MMIPLLALALWILNSELQPERPLQVSCVPDNRGNLAHLRIANGGVRISKLWMVEHVKRLYAELQIDLLMNGEGLKERRVEVRPRRTQQRVATGIAVGVR